MKRTFGNFYLILKPFLGPFETHHGRPFLQSNNWTELIVGFVILMPFRAILKSWGKEDARKKRRRLP